MAQLFAPPISIYDVKASAMLKQHSATCHPPCFLPVTADFLEAHTLAGFPPVTFTFSSVHSSVASVPTTFPKPLSPKSKAFLLLDPISAAHDPSLSSSSAPTPIFLAQPSIWLLPLAVPPSCALFRILDLTLLLFPFHSTLSKG